MPMSLVRYLKKKYTENSENAIYFEVEHIMKVSVAAAALATWVNCLILYK